MTVVAETERLLLRAFIEMDAEAAESFWGNADIMSQSGGATSKEALPRVLKAYQECHSMNQVSVYAVVEKETNHVIGAAGFNVTGPLEHIELIYHFSQACWGKGFAAEAAAACLQLAKKHPDVLWVYASADPENRASLKILERLGFTFKRMQWFEDTQQEEPYYELDVRTKVNSD